MKQADTNDSGHFEIFKTLFAGLFLVAVVSMTSNIYSDGKRIEQAKPLSTPEKSSVINTEPIKTPVPGTKAGTQVKKVVQPTPTPASDYVRCNISATCGGGYKEMTKSTCDEMVCCTYSLDYPPMFTSRSNCEARVKQYEKPVLTPDWGNQSSYTYPSSTPSTNSDNEVLRQKLITDCKANAQRTMYDTMSLCPIYGGVQDSTCIARAQATGAQVSANCDNIE